MKTKGMIVAAFALWFAAACVAQAKTDKAEMAAKAKAHQRLMQQLSKAGLRGQDLREVGAATKKDDTLGQAVLGALDQGLHGRELADFCRAEMQKREVQAGDATGNGMGHGKGMGGMGRMGGGMGQGGAGMGRGMGMGQGGMGRGMGMGRGGMGMGRGMQRRMGGPPQ